MKIKIDFTFEIFRELLINIKKANYLILSVKEFINNFSSSSNKSTFILRHDVDRFPNQTLQMARIEADIGISSTYYFRTTKTVFKDNILKEVADLGHEIGYHYEDLTLCKGNFEKAIESFEKNLEEVRKYYPVQTICMHGSPMSPWDNKKLWEKYDYKKYGLIADTSIDIDYDKVFYITDNGFGWNRTNTSVRDKVETKFRIPIKNTSHLIKLIQNNSLPPKIMLNAHPDTFFDDWFKWHLNFLFINSKNIIKWFVVKFKILK